MAATRPPAGNEKRRRSAVTQPEIRTLLVRMNYEGLKALRQLALDKDRTCVAPKSGFFTAWFGAILRSSALIK
jgi:hypothetical protein